MRRSSLLLITTLLGFSALPVPQTPVLASCAAPYLEVAKRLVVQHGQTVTIEGRAFTEGGCQDSMTCTGRLGCDSCAYDDAPPVPMDDVRLQLAQRARTWNLGVAEVGAAETNQLGWVSWTFELPPGANPGPAQLLTERAEAVRIRIR
ncbi:MAG TPA: hypothetical protein VER55_14655 [Ardenticatenaceae bacterium]|nr:hypothetical protein [Ardenticatenaceae bacterium]